MCNNSMGFPFCYSLHNSEYLVHSLLRPPMIGLISSLGLVGEEISLKVIRRDLVIHFNSLTFAWIALSGFQSTGKPFFAQVALSDFQLAGCTDFFYFIPNFCPNLLVHRDAPFFLPRCVNLAGLLCVVSFDYVRIRKVWQIVGIHGG